MGTIRLSPSYIVSSSNPSQVSIMPPVEFDSIPRFASSGVKPSKEALISSNDVLELGAFSPVVTRSKGSPSKEDGSIKDVEVPEVDSEDETTMDKLMKNYSEDESDEDSDYVPSEESDSEDELDSTENDFMMTRSKGIPPIDSGIVQDVDIPEVDSEDETTMYKLMEEYDSMDDEDYVPVYCEGDSLEYEEDSSDDETVLEKVMKEYEEGEDSDYVPSEESEEELEYDSEAEISDSDYDSEELEDYSEDESDLDGDYVPGEEVEGDIEFDSDASITECSEDESEEESEESCSEVDSDAEEHDVVEDESQEMDEDS